MSADEELQEHVHHAREPFDKLVAGSMAIIAAVLAVVSVFGQHLNAEKLLAQQKASDQWAYYQSKDIRRYTAQLATDLFGDLKAPADLVQKYGDDSARYKTQNAEIQEKARDYEKESDRFGHEADFFHIGEVFLELAIVLCSLAILVKRMPLYVGGMTTAIIGAAIAVYGWAV